MDYRHILAATDFTDKGDLAVRRAAELARASGARLTLVHVLPEPASPSPLVPHYDPKPGETRREQAVRAARVALEERAADDLPEVSCEVCVGDPASEILALDRRLGPDLIVLSTHGRRGWSRLVMGSVCERVVQLAQADVLAVREHPDEAS